MTEVGIRRGTPADALLLSALAIETFPLACPPSTTQANIDEFCSTNLSPQAFDGYLSDPAYRAWIAMDREIAVGYLLSRDGEPLDDAIAQAVAGRPCREISKIYVRAELHGSSVAMDLLAESINDAVAAGLSSAWLGVNQENARANRFYQRNGFELVGERTFLVGDSYEADYVREKDLIGRLTDNS